MSIKLFRVDDRLIHGQVVVGWGQPLHVGFIALVDDAVRASPFEQELYRMGVPPHIEVIFASVAEAATRLALAGLPPRVAGIRPAIESGLLAESDIQNSPDLPSERVDYGKVIEHKRGLLERARLTDDADP